MLMFSLANIFKCSESNADPVNIWNTDKNKIMYSETSEDIMFPQTDYNV